MGKSVAEREATGYMRLVKVNVLKKKRVNLVQNYVPAGTREAALSDRVEHAPR